MTNGHMFEANRLSNSVTMLAKILTNSVLVFVIIDDVLEDSGTGFTAINPRNVITLHFNSSEITRVYRSYFDLYFFVVVNFLAHVNSLEHFRRLLTMNGRFF